MAQGGLAAEGAQGAFAQLVAQGGLITEGVQGAVQGAVSTASDAVVDLSSIEPVMESPFETESILGALSDVQKSQYLDILQGRVSSGSELPDDLFEQAMAERQSILRTAPEEAEAPLEPEEIAPELDEPEAMPGTTSNLIGSVIVTGTFSTEGTLSLNNSTFTSNTALLSITASDDFVTQAPSNTNYMLHVTGKANSVTRVVLDSFGANTYPLFAGRMGRGSAAAPAAVANNDVMFRVVGNGWTGTEFPGSSPTKIDFVATEDFSDTNRGTAIEFWNTPVGSNNIQRIATFNAGEAKFTGSVIPEKGFVFVPRLPVNNQTSITVDFDTDSMVKATHIADLTVTLTNFQSGKIVEVWLVNTGGQNRTVTHGCTALNSTNKSTTVTSVSGSSLCLRYFSIGTDSANTFVSIIGA